MSKICKIIILLIFFIVLDLYLYAGIGVNPVRVETSAEPGKEKIGFFKLNNTGDRPINVTVEFNDWLNTGIDPSTWIRFEPDYLIVGPKQIREVKYIVNVPEGVSGERAIRIMFNGKEGESSIAVGIGVHLYVAVKGTEKIEAEIKEFNANYKDDEGVNGSLVIENKGNVHIRPRTVINILDNEGNLVNNINVPYDNPVQAGSSRNFNFNNKDLILVPGKYKIVAKSDCGSLHGIESKITGELEMVVGEKEIAGEDKQTIKITNEEN